MKPSVYYEDKSDKHVVCLLCPHKCTIPPQKTGICRVRKNIDGILHQLNYGRIVSVNIDPIEKKPLYHFYPASQSLSIATVGCNFRCLHCQNYSISQASPFDISVPYYEPEKIVQLALQRDCISISYTYTEPTVFFEYALDCARLAKSQGIKNVFVSNGYTSLQVLQDIVPYLDANNIDLKGDAEFYRKVTGGKVEPVLETIKYLHAQGVWIEVTTLIIPSYNDSAECIRWVAESIAEIDTTIPWHVTAFYPAYKMTNNTRTDSKTLHSAVSIGKQVGLRYIYVGNTWADLMQHTYCPQCQKPVIKRSGFSVLEVKLNNSKCGYCGCLIDGRGLP